MSDQVAISKITARAAEQSGVLMKLILFSLSLGILPLSSYFLSAKYVWGGNPTYAAITAIVVANSVLVTYIFMSILEERKATSPPGPTTEKPESRKER